MSRSGYNYDGWDSQEDQARWICWRGAVASALRGRRGQAFLRETLRALDALPEMKLIAGNFERDGCVCLLGATAKSREMDFGVLAGMVDKKWSDREHIAGSFGIAEAMAAEMMDINDGWTAETDEERFVRVRAWVVGEIKADEEEQQ